MSIIDKIVRDKIPEIIEKDGFKCSTEIIESGLLIHYLNSKLYEETNEYLESDNYDVLELVDVVEVIHGILKLRGITIEEFEKLRLEKKEKNGGFDKGIYLKEIFDSNS